MVAKELVIDNLLCLGRKSMGKKIKHMIVFIFVMSLIVAITFLNTYYEAKQDIWKICSLALESGVEMDPVLNDGMKYIAIDFTSAIDFSPKDKERVLSYFNNKYQIDVIESSFEELRANGLVGDGNSIEGILLSINKISTGFLSVKIEGRKFRSGLGAVGFKAKISYGGINR